MELNQYNLLDIKLENDKELFFCHVMRGDIMEDAVTTGIIDGKQRKTERIDDGRKCTVASWCKYDSDTEDKDGKGSWEE